MNFGPCTLIFTFIWRWPTPCLWPRTWPSLRPQPSLQPNLHLHPDPTLTLTYTMPVTSYLTLIATTTLTPAEPSSTPWPHLDLDLHHACDLVPDPHCDHNPHSSRTFIYTLTPPWPRPTPCLWPRTWPSLRPQPSLQPNLHLHPDPTLSLIFLILPTYNYCYFQFDTNYYVPFSPKNVFCS